MTRRLVVCGGTSLAHALAAVLGADPQNEVVVWTRQPRRWSPVVRAIYLDVAEVRGRVSLATSDAEEAVAGADAVFDCLPLTVRRAALQSLAPHLPPTARIVGVPGFGGFDQDVRAALGTDVRVCGLQRVPYVRKTISYGEAVWISGIRPRLFVGSWPADDATEVAAEIERLLGIPTSALSSYLPVSLSASNSIFHPARLMTAFPRSLDFRWAGGGKQFYEDWDDAASEAYLAMDQDVQQIARALEVSEAEAVPIAAHFGVADAPALTARIRGIRALRDRRLPIRREHEAPQLDRGSPYVTEDAAFALVMLRRLADVGRVDTPWLNAGVRWAEAATGRKFLSAREVAGSDASALPVYSGAARTTAVSLA